MLTFRIYSNRAKDAAKLAGLDRSSKLIILNKAQTRLLSICAELVGNPTLICLDDPLSGLDEIGASQVLDVLSHISRRQHSSTTVVYCSNQPGHCILKGVNRLIVLAGSKMVFNQDISELSLQPAMRISGAGLRTIFFV